MTIFSRIVAGEIPCYKVAENNDFLAFLDITPVQKGHVLVIPKKEIDYIFDIEDDLIGDMMIFSKKLANAIKAVFPCERIGVAVIGLEVPHAHIHLIPINSLSDMDFKNVRLKLDSAEMSDIAQRIHQAYIAQ